MAINFIEDPWKIRKNGREYKALGYERRGIFSIPIADFIGGVPIQCAIYEIIHGIIPAVHDHFISVESPNNVELVLLEEYGWRYDGCFICVAFSPSGQTSQDGRGTDNEDTDRFCVLSLFFAECVTALSTR